MCDAIITQDNFKVGLRYRVNFKENNLNVELIGQYLEGCKECLIFLVKELVQFDETEPFRVSSRKYYRDGIKFPILPFEVKSYERLSPISDPEKLEILRTQFTHLLYDRKQDV